MKKLLLAALLVLTSQARASWSAYYTGEAYLPSTASDALYQSPAAVFSNIGNPTSPTPGQGSQWFANPTTDAGYATIPTSVLGLSSGTIAFYYDFNQATGYQIYDLLRVSQTFNSNALLIQFDAVNQRLIVSEGGTQIIASAPLSVSMQANHLITFTYTSSLATIQIDSGAVLSSTTGYSPAFVNGIYVLSSRGTVAGSVYEFLDGLAFGSTTSESFPPAVPSPTPTPVYSATSTRTATPTFTPTVTGTSTITPTATKTVSLTSTPTPTNSPTPSVTPTTSPTRTITGSPTFSPTTSPTATITPTATQTATPYPTAVPTPQFAPVWSFVVFGQPQNLSNITLTASTSWQYVALSGTAQPMNITIANPGTNGLALNWWLDSSTSTPAFSGMSLMPGNTLQLDYVPGNVLHWTTTGSGNGASFLQTRY